MFNSKSTVLDQRRTKYPEAKVIVLDDSFNTYQHVASCLLTIIQAWVKNHGSNHQSRQEVGRSMRELEQQSYIWATCQQRLTMACWEIIIIELTEDFGL